MVGKYKVITLCGSTKFKDEFLNGTFYKSFRFYDQDAPISLSCSFDTETEDQFDEYTRPKIHFFLGSK